MKRARVALLGGGTIAHRYVDGLRATPEFEVVAVGSRTGAGAQALATRYGIKALTTPGILADPGIDYVLNLTPAAEHAAVTRACLEAGKHVYSEKPLAADLPTADALIALAEVRGLLLACAPATAWWPPLATMRRLSASGSIGDVVGACSVLAYPGPELFHPDPAHLYGIGAGPLFDMGVYPIDALLDLLGPADQVVAMASRASAERSVLVGPRAGERFPVGQPTHVHAQVRHASGAISSIIVSFDAVSATAPRLELLGRKGGLILTGGYGTDATLLLAKRPGVAEPIAFDPPGWSDAMWAIGASQAWAAFHQRRPVPTSAARARNTLALLFAIAEFSREP